MQDDSFTNTHAWLGVPVAVGSAHVSPSYCQVHRTGVAINRTLPPPQDCSEVTLCDWQDIKFPLPPSQD